MFYYVLYRSRLIPRFLSLWGLGGAALLLAVGLLIMFARISSSSTISTVLTVPIAVQEMVLAVWLLAKGFDSPEIAAVSAKT